MPLVNVAVNVGSAASGSLLVQGEVMCQSVGLEVDAPTYVGVDGFEVVAYTVTLAVIFPPVMSYDTTEPSTVAVVNPPSMV